MQDHDHSASALDTPEPSAGFDARFRSLLAEMTDQDEAVARLLEAQGLEHDELDDAYALPDSIAAQFDDLADEQIEADRRQRAPRLSDTVCAFALRA